MNNPVIDFRLDIDTSGIAMTLSMNINRKMQDIWVKGKREKKDGDEKDGVSRCILVIRCIIKGILFFVSPFGKRRGGLGQ